MSYKTNTNRNADFAESLVYADLISKGWITLSPSSRDSPYDFVVDMGNKFAKVQVKKITSSNMIHKVIARGNQRVTKNGKVRNTIDYAKRGIDWLAGVDIKNKKVYYYSIENYSNIPAKTCFSVKAHKADEFPINIGVKKNTDY